MLFCRIPRTVHRVLAMRKYFLYTVFMIPVGNHCLLSVTLVRWLWWFNCWAVFLIGREFSSKIRRTLHLSEENCWCLFLLIGQMLGWHSQRLSRTFPLTPSQDAYLAGPMNPSVFLFCCPRTSTWSDYLDHVDRKDLSRFSASGSAYGRVTTCFYLSRLYPVRPKFDCHYIRLRIPKGTDLISYTRFEASMVALSGPKLGRVSYRTIQREWVETEYWRPPRKNMIFPGYISH
jgi:hypothetical protein